MDSQIGEVTATTKSSATTPLVASSSTATTTALTNITDDQRCRVPESSSYDVNKMVLCKHFDNLYYEAKIVGIQKMDNGETGYKVHYQGWNRRHDEVISFSDAAVRFLPFTHENCLEAKARLKAAQENFKNKKKMKKSTKADEVKDDSYNVPVINKKGNCKQTQSALVEKNKTLGGTFGGKRKLPVVDNLQLKRVRAEATPCVSVKIPTCLKDIIVEDQTRILNNHQLVRLPARFPVDVIISRYSALATLESLQENGTLPDGNKAQDEAKPSIDDTVKDLFNIMLGTQLLYKFEMLQYSDFMKTKMQDMSISSEDSLSSLNSYDGMQWKPSKTYGFIHLLRFFVKLDCLAKSVSSFSFVLKWKRRSHQRLIDQLHHFLEFLNKFRDEFYNPSQDYVEASAEYVMKVSEKAAV